MVLVLLLLWMTKKMSSTLLPKVKLKVLLIVFDVIRQKNQTNKQKTKKQIPSYAVLRCALSAMFS